MKLICHRMQLLKSHRNSLVALIWHSAGARIQLQFRIRRRFLLTFLISRCSCSWSEITLSMEARRNSQETPSVRPHFRSSDISIQLHLTFIALLSHTYFINKVSHWRCMHPLSRSCGSFDVLARICWGISSTLREFNLIDVTSFCYWFQLQSIYFCVPLRIRVANFIRNFPFASCSCSIFILVFPHPEVSPMCHFPGFFLAFLAFLTLSSLQLSSRRKCWKVGGGTDTGTQAKWQQRKLVVICEKFVCGLGLFWYGQWIGEKFASLRHELW